MRDFTMSPSSEQGGLTALLSPARQQPAGPSPHLGIPRPSDPLAYDRVLLGLCCSPRFAGKVVGGRLARASSHAGEGAAGGGVPWDGVLLGGPSGPPAPKLSRPLGETRPRESLRSSARTC